MRRQRPGAALAAVLIAVLAAGHGATAAEWGRTSALPERPGLYWEHCGGCHGSAGRFAPGALEAANGEVRVKATRRPLEAFLKTHPVRLTGDETRILTETLHMVVTEGAAFQNRCAICHGPIEPFARDRLLRDDNTLIGRYSRRDIARFLEGHARLDAEGASFFADVLRRFASRTAR